MKREEDDDDDNNNLFIDRSIDLSLKGNFWAIWKINENLNR